MKEQWDERFRQAEYLYGSEANVFIQQVSQQIELQGKTLAIAEGEGRNAIYLAKQAKAQGRDFTVELWDYSAVALNKAKAIAEKQDVEVSCKVVDLNDVEWQSNQFQNVICVFGHFDEVIQNKVLAGVRETLLNGGWFIGEVYSQQQLDYKTGGPQKMNLLYDPKIFLKHFQQDHFRHFYFGEAERHEGELHCGKCHVIQFAIQIVK